MRTGVLLVLIVAMGLGAIAAAAGTRDPELTRAFGLADCSLQPGVEKDVSAKGCAAWKPVATCGEDHDLLALDDAGRLYFGVRPADNDMCTRDKRPTGLLPPVVKS